MVPDRPIAARCAIPGQAIEAVVASRLTACRAAEDFDRCADDVEWKRDQRAAEIMRDYNAQAAQIMQEYDRRYPR